MFRRYCNLTIETNKNNENNFYLITKNDITNFSQDVNDFRKDTRIFSPIEQQLINYNFLDLVTKITSIVNFFNPNNSIYQMDIHQIRLLAYPNLNSDNSPEGMHQDGADFIVSALVLNKHNIVGGNSIIYDNNKNEIYKDNLEVGDFILQEDKNLWHDITPIKALDGYIGYRDILGFDLKVDS